MPSNRSPAVVSVGPGRLAAGQITASSLSFQVSGTDVGQIPLATRTRTTTTVAVGPVSSIVLPANTFVGQDPTYSLNDLFNVVTGTLDQPYYNSANANPISVSSITGASVGDGFTTSTVTLNLSFAIPNGVSYRVYYYTKSTVATEPVDAFAFRNNYWLRSDAVGFRPGAVNWADSSANTTYTNVQSVLDDFVTKLASTTSVSDNGGIRVGTVITDTWAASGGGGGISATTVSGALSEIVSDLRDAASVSGAHRVGHNWNSTTWTNGDPLTTTNVGAALINIVDNLNDAGATAGAHRIGFYPVAGGGTGWTLTNVNVNTAINEVVNTLATQGSSWVGVTNTYLYAGDTITSSGAGGIRNDADPLTLQDILVSIDKNLVARRSWTGVITDNSTTVGGDYNSPTLSGLSFPSTGTSFLRSGTYTMTSVPSAGSILVGESADTVSVYANGTQSYGDVALENLSLRAGSSNLFQFLGTTTLRNVAASAGALRFYGSPVKIDGLTVSTYDNKNEALSVLFYPMSGTVKNLKVTRVCSSGNTSSRTALQLEGGAGNEAPLVFENCDISPTTGYGTGGGDVLKVESAFPVVFRGTKFSTNATSNVTVASILSASNVTFEDCIFEQNGNGPVLFIDENSYNVRFVRCKFRTSPTTENTHEIAVYCSDPLLSHVFRDCTIEIRSGGATPSTPNYRVVFGYDGNLLTDVGYSSSVIDGLDVYLSYGNASVSSDLFYYSAVGEALPLSRIRFHFIGKSASSGTIGGVYDRVIKFKGVKGNLTIREFDLYGIQGPADPHERVSLVELERAVVLGGTVQATASPNSNGYRAIFYGTLRSSVEKVDFWRNGPVVRGKLTKLDNSTVRDCTVRLTTYHASEDSAGYLADAYSSEVVDNLLRVTENPASQPFSIIKVGGPRNKVCGNNIELSIPNNPPNGYGITRSIPILVSGPEATFTAFGNFYISDKVYIGRKVYTFEGSPVPAGDGNVLLGADEAETIANLRAAINLETPIAGRYSGGTTANLDVTATSSGAVLTVTPTDVAGFSPTVSKISASLGWQTDFDSGYTFPTRTLLFTGNPANGDTVTFIGDSGSKVYNFRTTLTNVDGYVQIGVDQYTTRDNLVAAINLDPGGSGTAYAAATTVNRFVRALGTTTPASIFNPYMVVGPKFDFYSAFSGNGVWNVPTFTSTHAESSVVSSNVLTGFMGDYTGAVPVYLNAIKSFGRDISITGNTLRVRPSTLDVSTLDSYDIWVGSVGYINNRNSVTGNILDGTVYVYGSRNIISSNIVGDYVSNYIRLYGHRNSVTGNFVSGSVIVQTNALDNMVVSNNTDNAISNSGTNTYYQVTVTTTPQSVDLNNTF